MNEFAARRDPDLVLGDVALQDVARLLDGHPEDVEAIVAAAWLHWFRADVLPEAEQEDEIRRAVELFETVAAAVPEYLPPEVRDALSDREPSEPWREEFERFRDTDDAAHLDRAITILRDTAGVEEPPGSEGASRANLAALLRERAVRTLDPAGTDIDESITIGRALVRLLDDERRAAVLNNLASSFLLRFERRGEHPDLDEAARIAALAVAEAPPGRPGRATYLANFSAILLDRYRHRGTRDDIEPAVAAAREAAATSPDGVPEQVTALATLGLALRSAFEVTGRPADLSEAVLVGRRSVELAQESGWVDASALVNLSQSLLDRFELNRSGDDLAEAATVGTAALCAGASGEPVRLVCLTHLGNLMCARFEVGGDRADLDEAVRLLTDAATAAHDTDPDLPVYRLNLAYALAVRHELTGSPADAETVIASCRAVLDALPSTAPEGARAASTLALALHGGYLDGRVPDLEEATALARAAVATATGERADRGTFASNLSTILQTRFTATGDPVDADGAVEAARTALTEARFARSQVVFRSNLAAALITLFEVRGRRADLDEALEEARAAVAATTVADPDGARRLLNLAAALSARYETVGSAADLASGLDTAARAVDGCPKGHPLRAATTALLSALRHASYLRTGTIADIDRAVAAASAAVDATPPASPERAGRLANLAAATEARAGHPGLPRRRVEQDLSTAIRAGEQALEVAYGADRALMLNNLGATRRRRSEQLAEPEDLQAAIGLATEAVNRTPSLHPNRTLYLTNLALALTDAHQATGEESTCVEALTRYEEASSLETAPVRERMHAAWWGGRLAASTGDLGTAARLLADAVALLPRAAWHGLDRLSREDHLARAQGLASEAAALSTADNRAARAVELVELGRAVSWARTLDDGVDLGRVRHDHAELADRLTELREQLR